MGLPLAHGSNVVLLLLLLLLAEIWLDGSSVAFVCLSCCQSVSVVQVTIQKTPNFTHR